MYEYLSVMANESQPLSRAGSCMEALKFFVYTFGAVKEYKEVVTSPVLAGMANMRRAQMGFRKQAVNLTAGQLSKLENGFEDKCLPNVLQVCLGGFLLMVYLRARYSDGNNILDVEFQKDSVVVTISKTKTVGVGNRLPLDMVAPKQTVSGVNLFKNFLDMRSELEIPLGEYPLIPAYDGESWLRKPARVSDFNKALNAISVLLDIQVKPTSHSGKATLLSFCAKFGLDPTIRKALGYHADGKDNSMQSYARDKLAYPIQKLSEVIKQIRTGEYDPDELHGVEISSDSDNDRDDSSEDAPDDPQGEKRQTDVSIATTLADTVLGIPQVDERRFMNQASDVIHAGRAGNTSLTKCGLEFRNFLRLAAGGDSLSVDKLCKRCFNNRVLDEPDLSEKREADRDDEALLAEPSELLSPTDVASDEDVHSDRL